MFRYKRVYLDNAASTPINKKVIKALRKLGRIQGNPQGENGEAHWALNKLKWARWQVAQALNVDEEEIFFCTGATEANQYAKTLWKMKSDKKVHDSLTVDNKDYDVWAMSYINNETGKADGKNWAADRVYIDLTATLGHICVDLHFYPQIVGASFSGHKIGSLQGVGVLYINKEEQAKLKDKLPKSPWSFAGGTPNVLGIYSLGIAIQDACSGRQMAERNDKIEKMVFRIADACVELGLRVECNTHIVNITFNNINGSLATSILAGKGIDISVGSACHSGGSEDTPSKILLAEGYSEEEALRTVRVSLSADNTMADVRYFIKNLRDIIDNYDNV